MHRDEIRITKFETVQIENQLKILSVVLAAGSCLSVVGVLTNHLEFDW